ncbi:MAG: hypothetical protein KGZ86_05755 [Candidatus Latescibacteria bacterium]|nr:hypothetical protein [Candidatus Latescibacterota bacterium]
MKHKSEALNSKSEIKKSVCPFCLYGCELAINEINRGDFILYKNEYDAKSDINQGRLCARGNLAPTVLNHKRRLAYPLFNNKNVIWNDALKQISSHLKSIPASEIAVTYDTNNTIEELTAIFSFAQELKVDKIARTYLHPESFLSYGISNIENADLKDIANARQILIIGDVFSKSPVIAKPILDAKYADRSHRLFYIDSVNTKLAGFANKFIWTKPNTEPIVLAALILAMGKPAKDMLGDRNFNSLKKLSSRLLEICGVLEKDIQEICQSITANEHSVILCAIDFGKTKDPLLLSLLAQLIAVLIPGKKFLAPALSMVPFGKVGFGSVLEMLDQEKIKALINFGEDFPYYYPQVFPYLNKLDMFIHADTFRNPHISQISGITRNYTLAVPSLLEKSGTINTLWSRQNLKPVAPALNGTKPIPEILDSIVPYSSTKTKPRLNFNSNLNIDDVINRLISFVENYKDNPDFTVIGEETPFAYRGLFENDAETIKINPLNAEHLNIKPDDKVILSINGKEKTYIAKITPSLPNHTAAVSVTTPDNRELFPIQTDDLTKEILVSTASGIIKKVGTGE